MSTLRVSNIEAKADVSSPTVDEKIKFTNSSGDVLFHLDGKTSGITTVGINTTGNTFTVNNTTGDVSFSGSVTSSGVSTFSSDVSIADKIVHIGDTDTAIRFPAADTITAETGGSERLRIDSSGNVTIDTNTLFVDSVNNRIGIGTTQPDSTLSVDSSSDRIAVFNKTAQANPYIEVRRTNNLWNAGSGSGLYLTEFNNISPDPVNIARMYWTKDDFVQSNSSTHLKLESSTNSGIIFKGNTTEWVRISGNGNVGIGTDNPQGKLTVSNGSAGLEFNPNSEQAIVSYNRVTSTYTPIGLQGSVVSLGIGGVGEALRITSSGNIGIGTFIPTTKFEVGDVSGGVRTPDFSINTVSTASSITIGRLSSVGGDNTSFRIRDRVDRTILYTYVSGVDVGQLDYSSTNLNIKNGNLVFSTSGTGIDFSATSDGSGTASSELLDDYEEGTCTLYLATSSKTSQISSSGGTGITYTKIGRKIHIYGYIVFNNIQSTLGSNHVHLWGFPYNFSSLGNSVDNGIWMWTNGTAPYNYWNGRFPGISQNPNSDGGGVYSHGYNGYKDLLGTDFGNNGLHFNFDYTYQI